MMQITSALVSIIQKATKIDVPDTINTDEPVIGNLSTDIKGSINNIIWIVFSISSFIAVLLVINGAITILNSGGDPNKIKEGREQITQALLGFALILGAVTVVRLLMDTFLGGGINY